MAAMSSSNLFALAGDEFDFRMAVKSLPRVVTAPGIIAGADCSSDDGSSTASPVAGAARTVIVAHSLPVTCAKNGATGQWSFAMDDDSLLVQLRDGIPPETEVVYVGTLRADIAAGEQDAVSHQLFTQHRCIPAFLSGDVHRSFYHGFCKRQLWPLFHYMLPAAPFDRQQFSAYVAANKAFADRVIEAINSDEDAVWVHDYHLMLLPTLLRKKLHRVKLGFFLHSPFPSSEMYRTLPVRDEILRSLLNADLLGFQTFDYARHFLSCCSRLLGLTYESKRGYISLDYYGRTVAIKILSVGVHVGRLESVLALPETASKLGEIKKRFAGKTVVLGVDDMDIFKGISLKFLGLELLLQRHPGLQGQVVLVQIFNPARSAGRDVDGAREEAFAVAERINARYSSGEDAPVVLIDEAVPLKDRAAYYAAADCCIVNAVRDGMNLVPYEYTVCRHWNAPPCESVLIVSEFVGCSPSLSAAFRVNPWSAEDVADALYRAVKLGAPEKQLRHEKHYRYVSSHDVGYWARSFMLDLERACRDHYSRRCWPIGFGLNFRIVALSPGYRKLSLEHVAAAYARSARRAVFLDYDGTIVPQSSVSKAPSEEVVRMLRRLCGDPKNTVFVVSGRGRYSLAEWLAPCEGIGVAAEHGYFIRWSESEEWETASTAAAGAEWKQIAEPVMRVYTETTDGSSVEAKESALVWHYRHADCDFGSCQAKELNEHLKNVLASEPVVVKRGQHIVEVKPQEVGKGMVVEKVIGRMPKPPDFVMCVGDDRSDEDMFEAIGSMASGGAFPAPPEVFACSVGQKPSKAKYFVDDCTEVVRLLSGLAAAAPSQKASRLSPVADEVFKDLLEVVI